MKSYFEKPDNKLPSKGSEYYFAYRLLFIPFLIVALHNFEDLTYTRHSIHIVLGIKAFFLMLISAIVCLQVYLLTLHTGPKWQIVLYKFCLVLVVLNIVMGFFTKYSTREWVEFTDQDQINIHKKDKRLLKGMALLDTNNAFVVGKYIKRMYFLKKIRFIGDGNLTSDQQFKRYENILLPKDFETYWSMIDTTGNNTSERLIGDYYGWQYVNYDIYIYLGNCSRIRTAKENEDSFREKSEKCFLSYTEKSKPRNFEPLGEIFKNSGGWPVLKDRLQKYYIALEETFFPTYARTDLVNDPYFLIEHGKYAEAKAGLNTLPENRRLFCENKLKALGKW